MPVTGIDHINIRTLDIEASKRFYMDLFGFAFSTGPAAAGNRSNWLIDDAGQAIIHFRLLEPAGEATGALDHVALKCTDKAAIIERLNAQAVPFQILDTLTPGLTQIFLKDPHGVMLELNFAE